MLQVFKSSWALLLGLTLLMLGNGMQSTLLGIRGAIEGFSTFELSVVMSGYFAGFLLASKIAPEMIRRVGHVRVFAALGSLISATLILFPCSPIRSPGRCCACSSGSASAASTSPPKAG
jgi:MFS family permease